MDHAVVEAELAAIATGEARATREIERDCNTFAERYLSQEVEPQFLVDSADFDSDPYLICADRYWNLRFQKTPTLATAVECAGWAMERIAAEYQSVIVEKWAIGYAFITRGTVESLTEIADSTSDIISNDDSHCHRAYFATLYHAGKLRANLCFDELRLFLESSPLAMAAGAHRGSALFIALLAFASFGSRQITNEHALSLCDQAWEHPDRTHAATDIVVHAVEAAVPFDEQGQLLRIKAAEAVAEYPNSSLFHFRLAVGEFLCDHHDAALSSIDDALRLLPADGWRTSHALLSDQFHHVRRSILLARSDTRRISAQKKRLDQQERVMAETAETAQRSVIRAVELVAVFAAVIAFAMGSLTVTLNGDLSLGARALILALFGGGNIIFALLVIGGGWLITRNRFNRRS